MTAQMGRRKGTTSRQPSLNDRDIRRRRGKRGALKGPEFYTSPTVNERPYGVPCYCFRCGRLGLPPYHRWQDPCPAAGEAA